MKNKRKLGIVGGMGSHATLWFFQRLIALTKAEKDQDYPEIIIHNNSNVPDRTQAIVYGGASPLEQLEISLEILNRNQVEIAVMACMTAYYYYKDIVGLFCGKLVNPLDLIAHELRNNRQFSGCRKIGVIGTTGLIRSGILHDKLEPLGYKIICLNDAEQEKYFMNPLYRHDGIKSGVINDGIRALFLHQVPLLKAKGADVIVGACSEVPLLIDSSIDLPFLDAIELMAVRTLEYCYAPQLSMEDYRQVQD